MKRIFFLTAIVIATACNNASNQDAGATTNGKDSASQGRAPASVSVTSSADSAKRVPLACSSHTISFVPDEIKQPKSMDCWATVLTMMYEWKQKDTLTIPQVMNQIGNPYKKLFQENRGISAAQKAALLSKAGLVAEPPANYTIGGWCDMLQKRGPLWVTTDESAVITQFAIHARLLYGMIGDGTPDNTLMLFIDPAKGSKVSETFNEFIVKYEGELRKIYRQLNGRDLPAGYKLRIQVIHW